MATFFSFDRKHIARLFGAVAGMDDQVQRHGDPNSFRSEFWERFGKNTCRVIGLKDKDDYPGLPVKRKGSFFFDPDECKRIDHECGSCGSQETCVYEVFTDPQGKFMMKKYVSSIWTHMGGVDPDQAHVSNLRLQLL